MSGFVRGRLFAVIASAYIASSTPLSLLGLDVKPGGIHQDEHGKYNKAVLCCACRLKSAA